MLLLGLYKIFFLLRVVWPRINRPFTFPPPTYIAQTVAILLHDYWAIHDPLSTSLFYFVHLTMLVITITCKGHAATLPHPPYERGSSIGRLSRAGRVRRIVSRPFGVVVRCGRSADGVRCCGSCLLSFWLWGLAFARSSFTSRFSSHYVCTNILLNWIIL